MILLPAARANVGPGRTGLRERGSGSVLAIGVVAALFASAAITLPFTAALPVKHRVKNTADAAALAAADVMVGRIPGVPCEVAEAVADANRADLVRCQVDGLVATVTAGGSVLGLPILATSSAGPPTPEFPLATGCVCRGGNFGVEGELAASAEGAEHTLGRGPCCSVYGVAVGRPGSAQHPSSP